MQRSRTCSIWIHLLSIQCGFRFFIQSSSPIKQFECYNNSIECQTSLLVNVKSWCTWSTFSIRCFSCYNCANVRPSSPAFCWYGKWCENHRTKRSSDGKRRRYQWHKSIRIIFLFFRSIFSYHWRTFFLNFIIPKDVHKMNDWKKTEQQNKTKHISLQSSSLFYKSKIEWLSVFLHKQIVFFSFQIQKKLTRTRYTNTCHRSKREKKSKHTTQQNWIENI